VTYPSMSGFMMACPPKPDNRENSMSTIIIGEENVKAVQAMTQLHFWRLTANMKIKFNSPPRKGWTIRAFNAMYDVRARSWQDVYDATNDTIKAMRAERSN
jgi:hypothetical protein